MESKWREILEQVERGELTPEQGAELLAAQTRQFETEGPVQVKSLSVDLQGQEEPRTEKTSPEAEVVDDYQSVMSFWKNWWTIPLWAGVIVCILSGLVMSSASASGNMFWFYCAMLPAMLGAIAIVLAFWSRKSRWVHIRIREDENGRKKNIAISMPLPTELVGWVMATFGDKIPGLRDQPEVIKMMPEIMKTIQETGDPLVVEVNDKDGSEVRVYIM
jgi:hypothetical protein